MRRAAATRFYTINARTSEKGVDGYDTTASIAGHSSPARPSDERF